MDNLYIQNINTNNKYEQYFYIIDYLNDYVLNIISCSRTLDRELVMFYHELREAFHKLYYRVNKNIITHLMNKYEKQGLEFDKYILSDDRVQSVKIPELLQGLLIKDIVGTNKIKMLKMDNKKYIQIKTILLCFKRISNYIKIPKILCSIILSMSVCFHDSIERKTNKYKKYFYIIESLDEHVLRLIANNIDLDDDIVMFYRKLKRDMSDLYDHVRKEVLLHLNKKYCGNFHKSISKISEGHGVIALDGISDIFAGSSFLFLREILKRDLVGENKFKALKYDDEKYNQMKTILLCLKRIGNIIRKPIPRVLRYIILSLAVCFHDELIQ